MDLVLKTVPSTNRWLTRGWFQTRCALGITARLRGRRQADRAHADRHHAGNSAVVSLDPAASRNTGRRLAGSPAQGPGENGAGEGTRTLDIQLGKLTLYQLSYARVL